MKKQIRQQHQSTRKGTAAVEFAVVLPLLLILIMGTIEIGFAMQASTVLNGAVREGGRLASMDFTDRVGPNETANQKVRRDIQNFITAAGFDGSQALVSIRHSGGPLDTENFDLEDESNNLKYFKIRATFPYSAVSGLSMFPVNFTGNRTRLQSSAVFRATRSSLAQ